MAESFPRPDFDWPRPSQLGQRCRPERPHLLYRLERPAPIDMQDHPQLPRVTVPADLDHPLACVRVPGGDTVVTVRIVADALGMEGDAIEGDVADCVLVRHGRSLLRSNGVDQ